jgi:glycosyltransferase involved in cell wall biosynthesis
MKQPVIVFLADFFDPEMGYISNFLPLEVSKLNAQVSIITSIEFLEKYTKGLVHSSEIEVTKNYTKVTLNPNLRIIGIKSKKYSLGFVFFNLKQILVSVKPDIVQSLIISNSISNLQLLWIGRKIEFKFFLQDHSSRSVFRPNAKGRMYNTFFKYALAPKLSKRIDKCFIPSPDIIDVVKENYGIVESKLFYQALGCQTDMFYYPGIQEKVVANSLRNELGINENSFMVLYAGRLTEGKGAFLLASAIELAAKSNPLIRGIFVGKGSPDEVATIESFKECRVIPMQRAQDLNKYYWAADVCAWTREGSTSILDAMACGKVAIVRSGLTEPDRRLWPEFVFLEESVSDLARVILFASKSNTLAKYGQYNSKHIVDNFGWNKIAKERTTVYGVDKLV